LSSHIIIGGHHSIITETSNNSKIKRGQPFATTKDLCLQRDAEIQTKIELKFIYYPSCVFGSDNTSIAGAIPRSRSKLRF
jgi:hypothetical protein